MSTRSSTHFTYGGEKHEPAAIVYRHWDGYPDGHGLDLFEFFAEVERQTRDTRFDDPTYLAAKLVVWLADKFGEANQLDFLGVGVVTKDPEDIEFYYVVNCGELDANGRPTVKAYVAGTGDPAEDAEVVISKGAE